MSTFKWETHFQDTGCEYSPRCQTCPLPKCKHEMSPRELAQLRFNPRRARAVESYRRLMESEAASSQKEIVSLAAAEAGITDRTVYRALESARTTTQPGSA